MHIQIYASKKTESQVDMKEAKRMTLFNIMINVSRNGIKAIMKNDPIKYLQKTRRKCGLQSPTPSLTKPMLPLKVCLYDRPQAHNSTKHSSSIPNYRDENFQRIREMSRILSRQDRSCESSRSVEIFF